jgi:hypothetical protein
LFASGAIARNFNFEASDPCLFDDLPHGEPDERRNAELRGFIKDHRV